MPRQVAVIFVQPGPYDEKYAYAAISHCRRRGYVPGMVVHGDWRAVELMLKRRRAQTVIVACGEYPHVDSPLVETKPISAGVRWTMADVEAVIDGDGPIPAGLDPEMVWAVRRLAEHLRHCPN